MNYSSKVDERKKQVHGIEKKYYSELVERLISLKWWAAVEERPFRAASELDLN
jgi:hypothetical protein